MQTSLIYLLIFCLLMAGITFYIGFIRPPRALAWLAKAGFLMWLFFLVPTLGYVLYQQSGAIERLESTGIAVHPAISDSIGVANGTGKEPTWLFSIEGDLKEIMAFYRTEDSHPGWTMAGGNETVIILEKGKTKMAIAVRKGWSERTIMFRMTRDRM